MASSAAKQAGWLKSAGLLVVPVVLLLGAEASANCPSGYYACGADYCTPSSGVCCASVGRPDKYCPSGSYCTSSGGCESSSGGGGGGGGGCPSGYYECGADYCTPIGGVCCASVGNPDQYCPGGTYCTASGGCADGSGSGGGGGGGDTGGCPSGYTACGADYCTPVGGVCCASVGRPDKYCPSGSYCTANGCSSSTGGGGTTGSWSGGSTSSGDSQCTETGVGDGCSSLKACGDTEGGYYDADGRIFRCNGSSCEAAAEQALDYCSTKTLRGCSAAPQGEAALPFLAFLVLGFLAVRRSILRDA